MKANINEIFDILDNYPVYGIKIEERNCTLVKGNSDNSYRFDIEDGKSIYRTQKDLCEILCLVRDFDYTIEMIKEF